MDNSLLNYYMELAIKATSNSDDIHTRVGAVLIPRDGAEVISGSNNFLDGSNAKKLPTERPHKYIYIQHAERNVLYKCLRKGVSTEGATLVCTLAPCEDCLRACVQSGIRMVVYRDDYAGANFKYEELADMDVRKTKTSSGLFVLEILDGINLSDEEVQRRVGIVAVK